MDINSSVGHKQLHFDNIVNEYETVCLRVDLYKLIVCHAVFTLCYAAPKWPQPDLDLGIYITNIEHQ